MSSRDNRPSPLLAWLFGLPTWLYRNGFGWVLGKRFLALTHRGRKSGRTHQTVLEVISYDSTREESVVVSAYGTKADWYRNLQTEPALRVRTGRLDYVPEQRFLDAEERAEMARRFCEDHPWEARLMVRMLPSIGAAVHADRSVDPVEMLSSLPMVALRPAG